MGQLGTTTTVRSRFRSTTSHRSSSSTFVPANFTGPGLRAVVLSDASGTPPPEITTVTTTHHESRCNVLCSLQGVSEECRNFIDQAIQSGFVGQPKGCHSVVEYVFQRCLGPHVTLRKSARNIASSCSVPRVHVWAREQK